MTPRPLARATAAMFLAGCAWACSGGSYPRADHVGAVEPPTQCDYDVSFVLPSELVVTARCDRPVQSFVASEAVMADHVRLLAAGAAVSHRDGEFVLPRDTQAVSYRIDLHAVSLQTADIDVAYEATSEGRRAWISAVSTWVLRPHPIARDTRAVVRVDMPEGQHFTSGMRLVDGRYELLAREIRFATYGVFGQFDREDFELPGPLALDARLAADGHSAPGRPVEGASVVPGPKSTARIELVTVPGALAATPALRSRWVRDTAGAISEFWRGFPVERALVVLIPTPGRREIDHGKVVAAGGAGVAIYIGALAEEPQLYGDWILVHELFHLGFPSFSGEGKWLDEGLATYFEPIIRARAGWRSREAVWGEFAAGMGQGLVAVEATGVEKTSSFRGIYWGGALLALLADVETRRQSGGKLGLEDGLRAVLARGGNASQLWKLDRTIAVIDERLGGRTLRSLADAHSFGGRPVDLPQLWRDLGVHARGDELRFDETARLAPIRHAILSPP